MLGEHYRFTRDDAWLRRAAPGIVAGADWIINETRRTANRHELERGLLPAGSLEDIGDWWTWLSTSCYTWRGLDSAAWALEQIKHPEAQRVRQEAGCLPHQSAGELPQSRRPLAGGALARRHRRAAHPFAWCTGAGVTSAGFARRSKARCTCSSPARSTRARRKPTGLSRITRTTATSRTNTATLLDDFDKYWFGRGGMSMQACLLLDVEPYLYRDDVKHALRALFNAQAAQYFPDVRMNTEHALPDMGDWRATTTRAPTNPTPPAGCATCSCAKRATSC